MSRRALNPKDYTIAWFTTLPIEAQIASLMLDKVHDSNFRLGSGDEYYVYQAGEMCGHNVIIVNLPKMYGNSPAAALASQVKMFFPNLCFGLLVGVGAGLPDLSRGIDIRLGDVLVGESIVSYDLDFGNVTKPGTIVASAFQSLKVEQDPKIYLQHYDEIKNGHYSRNFEDPGQEHDQLYRISDGGDRVQEKRGERPDSEHHRVWYGRIGSGDKVVKNRQKGNELRDKYGLIGLEMEAAGVIKSIPVGVILGVCDYGDEFKNKEWQPYAAAMAAAYAKAVLKVIPPNLTRGQEYDIPPNLPFHRNDNFVGRKEVFKQINEVFWPQVDSAPSDLQTGNPLHRKWITLWGLRGCGKSEIALEYAYRHANKYSTIFWFDASGQLTLNASAMKAIKSISDSWRDAEGILSDKICMRLAHTLGLDQKMGTSEEVLMKAVAGSPLQWLNSWLGQERNCSWLLIIDNYDDTAACKIDALFPTENVGHVLITSRRPDPYKNSKGIEVPSGIEPEEARELLLKTLGPVKDVSSNDQKSLSKIIESVGCLPLAITTAGAYLAKAPIPICDYARKLNENLAKQLGGLDIVWEMSYRKLSNHAKQLIQLFSLIRNQDIPDEFLKASVDIKSLGMQDKSSRAYYAKAVYGAVGELCSLSFVNKGKNNYHMYPLLHQWIRDHKENANTKVENSRLIVDIVTHTFAFDNRKSDQWSYERRILPHIKCCLKLFWTNMASSSSLLNPGNQEIAYKFARLYSNLGKVRKSSAIYERILKDMVETTPLTIKMKISYGLNLKLEGKWDEALTLFNEALVGTREGGSESLTIASHIAAIFTEKGKYPEAIEQYRRILAQWKSLPGDTAASVLQTRQGLAYTLRLSGQYSEARRLLEQIRGEKMRSLGEDHPSTLETVNAIAAVLENQGDYKESLKYHELVYERQRKWLGDDHYLTLDAVDGIARVSERLGKYDDALGWYQKELETMKKIFGREDHPWIITILAGIADIWTRQGKYKEAERMYRMAYKGFKSLGMTVNGQFPTAINIARALRERGQYEEALVFCAEAQEGLRELGEEHRTMLTAKVCFASIRKLQRHHKEALGIYEQVLAVYEKRGEVNHPEALKVACWIGEIHSKLGNHEKALEFVDPAAAKLVEVLGADHPHTVWAAELREHVLRKQEETEQATDSGYASMGRCNYEQLQSAEDIPDFDDAETVYSEASSVASTVKECYISELTNALFQALYADQPDIKTLKEISVVLPELLKAFALKIGHNSSHQIHRDIMLFVHKNRSHIAEYFEERCSRKEEEEESLPNTRATKSEGMSSEERVKRWQEGMGQFHTAENCEESLPNDQTTEFENMSSIENTGFGEGKMEDRQGLVLENGGPSHDDDHNDEEDKKNYHSVQVYRDFILKTPAFEWLIGILRREVLLTPTEPNSIETIRDKIIRFLPSSRKISKNQSAESFRAIFITDWKPLAFINEQGYDRPDEAVERAITLTGSAKDAQALTCAQYLCQTWPSTGKLIIQLIKDLIHSGAETQHTCTLPGDTTLTIYFQKSLELVAEAFGTGHSVAEIGQQLAWLGVALNSSPREFGVVTWIPSIRDIRVLNPQEMKSATPNLPGILCRLSFTVQEIEENFPLSNGQCWHNMFRNPVVVKGYPIPRRLIPHTGLEIPLNMMAGLARTEYIQTFNEKHFIKGFSTLLVPTQKKGDILIWHLIYNQNGDRISYLENTALHVEGLSVSELETTRHVLGWCPKAKYYAGAGDANYNIKQSGLSKPHEGCLLKGIYIHGRRIIKGGSSFSLGNKDIPFHISREDPIQKLKWIDRKFFVLWDEGDKRGWLVNGTSALLHLLRKSLEDNSTDKFCFEFRFKKEHMQEAPAMHKASSAVWVLRNNTNLKQEIYPTKEGYFLIENRLDELFDTLEKIIDHQIDIARQDSSLKIRARKYLEGWDFNDLATSQDPIYPRVVKFQKTSGWVDFTRTIHAVALFGRGFGEIIQPEATYPCVRWARLPKEQYYLAAAVDDLKEIMKIHGDQYANPMKLTDDTICQVTFGKCECRGEERAERHSEFVQIILPSTPCDALPTSSVQLEDGGAVVFGHNEECKWPGEDVRDPGEDESLSLSEVPESQFHDSGIGSSLTSFTCEDYKVGIVCALPKELLAVRALFDSRHKDLRYPPEDTNHYALGCIQQHNVVAAGLPSGEYGTCAAASVLVHMKRSFPNLSICLLVGIGGGVPSEKNDIRLGDVVVSQPKDGYPGVIQYDLGKTLENDGFVRTGYLQSPPHFIMTAISDLESDPDKFQYPLELHLKDIAMRHPKYKYPGRKHDPLLTTSYDRPTNHPKFHYGLIASGNQVMKSAQARDRLGSEYNILCFEMEAAGIMNNCGCLVVRGICDYSDSHKNDVWQEYAAATAAAYAKLLLSYARISNTMEAGSGSENTRSIKLPTLPGPKSLAPKEAKRLSHKNRIVKTFRGWWGR